MASERTIKETSQCFVRNGKVDDMDALKVNSQSTFVRKMNQFFRTFNGITIQ